MLEVFSPDDVASTPDGRLSPHVKELRKRLRWYERLTPCWLRLAEDHIYGSQIRYTGTVKRGTGWRVCSRCGYRTKHALVRRLIPVSPR
jgi:hypothetical protein